MTILGIDSSGPTISVGVVVESAVRGFASDNSARAAELLPILIQSALGAAQCELKAVDSVAVVTGPGSFTGLRTGISIALGLARALHRPIIGVSSLITGFWNESLQPGAFVATLPSLPGEVYRQEFAVDQKLRVTPTSSIDVCLLSEFRPAAQHVDLTGNGDAPSSGVKVALVANAFQSDRISRSTGTIIANWPDYDGLDVLYVKRVNAKTIQERQTSALTT